MQFLQKFPPYNEGKEMNDLKLAIVRLILFDFNESSYSDFEKYWDDHETHYLLTLDTCYENIDRELKKLGHLL